MFRTGELSGGFTASIPVILVQASRAAQTPLAAAGLLLETEAVAVRRWREEGADRGERPLPR